MEREKIGYRIRELREMHNYTREEIAEMVEISPKFLYEIESGKKGFSSEILCKIARKFTVSCDYIMCGEEQSLKISEKMYCILKQVETKQIIINETFYAFEIWQYFIMRIMYRRRCYAFLQVLIF